MAKEWRHSTPIRESIDVKVHIFDAKTHALHQPHTRAVKQSGYQRGYAVHLRQQPCHLVFGQHAGNAALLGGAVDAVEPGQFNSKNFPVKKQDRAQCLVVGRCGYLAVGGEMRQEGLDFAGTHLARVPHGSSMARPANEEADPVNVDLLGAEAIVHVPNALAQLVQNSGGLQHRGARFHRVFITGHISSILSDEPVCKPLSGGTHDQLMEQRPTYRAGFALDITLGLTNL